MQNPPLPSLDWCLFLDVDGTLVEFTESPQGGAADDTLKALLARVRDKLNGAVALISGRRVEHLDALFAPLHLPAAGLHGTERRDARGTWHGVGGIDPLLEPARARLADFIAQHPAAVLEEVWRILNPGGRMIVVVPSRRGVWARVDGTPFGQGQPYSKAQLRELMREALFSPLFWGEALHAPPFRRRFFINSALAMERLGAAVGFPFAGVHIVEATKQVYRPIGVRRVARRELLAVRPGLAPAAHREPAQHLRLSPATDHAFNAPSQPET